MSASNSTEIWADQIITPLRKGGVQIFSPGALVFSSQGEILSVSSLSKSKLRTRSKSIRRFKVVTPGFVDSHTHFIFAGNRADEWNERLKGATYQDISKKGGGIQKTMRETRRASEVELIALGCDRAKRFLSYGVTTIEAKSGYGLNLEAELKVLCTIKKVQQKSPLQIIPTFMGAHAKPKEFTTTADYISYLIKDVLPKVRGLARFQDVFCEAGYFSEVDGFKILQAGKKIGLIPKVHAHEFGRTGGVRLAAKVGAASADHLMVMSDEDIRMLKRAKVVPVVLPGTAVFLGGKTFAPARKMWDAGLPVAIASDFNPGTNPTQNFPLMGSFAAIFQKLSLEEILTAQTWHGARALRLSDRGCLEKGLRADFVAWDHVTFEEIYYAYGNSRVASVYLAGKKVL